MNRELDLFPRLKNTSPCPHDVCNDDSGAPGHAVVAVDEDAAELDALTDEAGRPLQVGEKVGLGNIGDLELRRLSFPA